MPTPGGGRAYRNVAGSPFEYLQDPRTDYPLWGELCNDTVNQKDQDNPLTLSFTDRSRWIPLSGSNGIPEGISGSKVYSNYYPDGYYIDIATPSSLASSIPSVGTVATATLARSNPSRPYVSVPNFLYELKDLPGMIRDIGRLRSQAKAVRAKGIRGVHPKVAASHYLSYQMGWRPLISDLKKLVDFQAQVDKKLRELENLYNKGGLQRRVRNPAWQSSLEQLLNSSLTVDSVLGSLVNCKVTQFSTIERWGTVRWKPSSLPDSRYSSHDMAALARRLVFGLNGVSAKQVWDAIPWTWLIGWFSNADEFLQAHSNTIPLSHSTPCVMTKTVIRRDWLRVPGNLPHFLGGEGTTFRTIKQRTTSSGTLSATIPFLSGRQISILGALAIQRKR